MHTPIKVLNLRWKHQMPDLPPALAAFFIFWIGACIGSFLNVCIFRIPEKRSVVFPGSACPDCGHTLSWWENIPLMSYLILRARCRECGSRISVQYPVVECVNGLFYLLFWLKFGLGIPMVVYCIFFSALFVVTLIDLEHYIIPDAISVYGIPAGFAASFFLPQITWLDSLFGILLGGGILYLVAWGYYFFTKREGMGGGDIKLLAMIGAFLGWQAVPAVIFFSAAAGSLLGIAMMVFNRKGRHYALPYGPFLAGAAVFYLFFGNEIIEWYLGILSVQPVAA